MHKRGLTSATSQRLQHLVQKPTVSSTPTPVEEQPPVLDRHAQIDDSEEDYSGEEIEEVSDTELILTIVNEETEPTEYDSNIPAEVENSGGESSRGSDPMLRDLKGEPWNHDWEVAE